MGFNSCAEVLFISLGRVVYYQVGTTSLNFIDWDRHSSTLQFVCIRTLYNTNPVRTFASQLTESMAESSSSVYLVRDHVSAMVVE